MTDIKKGAAFIKSRADGKAVVAGYGVVFGGEDLYGETFGKGTDFMLDLVPEKPVMFNHGMSVTHKTEDIDTRFSIKSFLGVVENAAIKMDEFGMFIEAVLDEAEEYAKEVLELIEKGVMGWSSGSVSHLIEMDGKNIKRWPIVEFSLTHIPAEPRTIGVEHIRGLFTDAGLEVPEALLQGDKPKKSAAEEEGVEEQNKLTDDEQCEIAAVITIERKGKGND